MARGMGRQNEITRALAVFRSADSTPEQIEAARKALLGLKDAARQILLCLIQELNQEEYRNADMRLCRGMSCLLARRQEHAATDAASRLLDATFMWPHVRLLPDLIIELKKSVIIEPTRRKRVDDLVKALQDLCLQPEVELPASQRELLSDGLRALLAQEGLDPQQQQTARAALADLAGTPEDQPLKQSYRRWKVLSAAVAELKRQPAQDDERAKSIEALASKIAKRGPQTSFVVSSVNRKILSNTLQRLQDRESKWKLKRGVTASTLRFEPTSMEQLQNYVERLQTTGMLADWQLALMEPFEEAEAGATIKLPIEAVRAWAAAEAPLHAMLEELCHALAELRTGEEKIDAITRQAVLHCLAHWGPRNGLEGGSRDEPLERLQDFLWGEHERPPEDLAASPSILDTLCQDAAERIRLEREAREGIVAKTTGTAAALKPGEAVLMHARAATWRSLQALPAILAEIVEGEAAPLESLTAAHRQSLSLMCLHLEDRYRRGRRQVAAATETMAGRVLEIAGSRFANRTQGEEVGNLRAIAAIWRQRNEEMLAGDLVRLLNNPFAHVRESLYRALLIVGRPAIPPLEHMLSRREINQLMAVETAELSKEDHTKLLERELRTGRTYAGRTLASIGASLAAKAVAEGKSLEDDADIIRVRRALHTALSDPRSGLEDLRQRDHGFQQHLKVLGLAEPEATTDQTQPET